MEKIKFKKEDITKLINVLKEQDETQEPNDELRISAEELQKLLRFADYNMMGLSKTKKFRDKKIIVVGGLDLSNKPIKSLKPIYKIEGNLDISNSEVASIDDVIITGSVRDWGSERAKIKERRRIASLRAEAQARREDDDWSIENADDEGLAAQAVFKYLQYHEYEDVIQSEEDVDNLRQLKERLGNLYYDQEQGNDTGELQGEIDALESDIEEIEEKIDVYELIPSKYSYYGRLYRFEIYSGDLQGQEYVGGKESDAERAALEYAEQYIDEHGPTGFNEGFYMDHLDEDGILDYFRDFYENDVRNNPDVYFNEDDFELTSEQEERKEQLENYIEEMESMLSNLEDEMNELEHNSDEYNELEEKLQEVQSNIDTAQEELDTIEPDTEPTEEMIDRQVENMLDDVKYDYRAKLDEFGMDISDWIDKDALAQAWVDADGYAIMNPYDESYDTVYIDETQYIVMRVN
jgi:DNA repair exonuclease SbcCD ATPase subunit